MIWTLEEICHVLKLNLSKCNAHLGRLQINSQEVKDGELFVALKGNRDGHDFVQDAIDNGAGAVLVSQHVHGVDQNKVIKVDDTMEAIIRLAEYKRSTSSALFMAVTGSVGKTSTKESLRIMFEAYGKTFASRGNFNNFLGTVINLASMPSDIDYAVFEMGMRRAGDIEELVKIVKPAIAILTSVSFAHLEFFESNLDIAHAKCEIFKELDMNTGMAILNRDIDLFDICMEHIVELKLKNVVTYGKANDANVKFISLEHTDRDNVLLHYSVKTNPIKILMPSIPSHLAENFGPGLAIIEYLKLDSTQAINAIKSFLPVMGRGNMIDVTTKTNSHRLLCDYYNSSPQSLKASLAHFATISGPNKIAILGDMRELGHRAIEFHKEIVSHIIDSNVNQLFLVGEIIKTIVEHLPNAIFVSCFDNVDCLLDQIDALIKVNSIILIKGSRTLQLEKIARHFGLSTCL